MLFIFELYANSLVFATELVFGIEFEREINDREKQTTTNNKLKKLALEWNVSRKWYYWTSRYGRLQPISAAQRKKNWAQRWIIKYSIIRFIHWVYEKCPQLKWIFKILKLIQFTCTLHSIFYDSSSYFSLCIFNRKKNVEICSNVNTKQNIL